MEETAEFSQARSALCSAEYASGLKPSMRRKSVRDQERISRSSGFRDDHRVHPSMVRVDETS